MDRVRVYVACVTVLTMITLSATGVMSLLTAALLASALLISVKSITLGEAFSAVKGRTLLAIVTTFGVGTAMEKTGAAVQNS